MSSIRDPSSNANIADYTGGHLFWVVQNVDFKNKELHCVSTQKFTKSANYNGGYLVCNFFLVFWNNGIIINGTMLLLCFTNNNLSYIILIYYKFLKQMLWAFV